MFFTFEESEIALADWTHSFYECILTKDWGTRKKGEKFESIILNFITGEIVFINSQGSLCISNFKILEGK
jgi:hypothetical protein